jgi:hypothetical protein
MQLRATPAEKEYRKTEQENKKKKGNWYRSLLGCIAKILFVSCGSVLLMTGIFYYR